MRMPITNCPHKTSITTIIHTNQRLHPPQSHTLLRFPSRQHQQPPPRRALLPASMSLHTPHLRSPPRFIRPRPSFPRPQHQLLHPQRWYKLHLLPPRHPRAALPADLQAVLVALLAVPARVISPTTKPDLALADGPMMVAPKMSLLLLTVRPNDDSDILPIQRTS